LKKTTAKGIFWSFIERIGHHGIRILVSIILARLLPPEQFGLIAMLWIFMTVAQTIVDSGFGTALIQKQDATHLDECSIFYFNILVGFLLAGLLYLAAPWISAFYNIPLLTPIGRILSLNLIINAFSVVQVSLLIKRLDFASQTKVSVIAGLLSGGIAIAMAYRGFGVWSLVAQSLLEYMLRTVLFWYYLPWRPSWLFSRASLRSMFPFGSRFLASGLLETFYDNLYQLVIGKLFSATQLGFYTRARQSVSYPAGNLSFAVGRVFFSVSSAMQGDKAGLKLGTRKALSGLAMVNFPLMIGMAVVAKPLVQVLLTDKWLPCVPYLQLMCIWGMFFPFNTINLNALIAQGHSDSFLRVEVFNKLVITVAVLSTAYFGIVVMIWGQIVSSAIHAYLSAYYLNKTFSYPISEQVKDCSIVLLLASGMGIVVHMAGYVPLRNSIALLLLQIVTGMVSYAALCELMKVAPFQEIKSMARDKCVSMLRRSTV
jgi:O-antigen/teichoic acid export membrane protein